MKFEDAHLAYLVRARQLLSDDLEAYLQGDASRDTVISSICPNISRAIAEGENLDTWIDLSEEGRALDMEFRLALASALGCYSTFPQWMKGEYKHAVNHRTIQLGRIAWLDKMIYDREIK